MIVAIGRARKDAKALGHALRIECLSLGGIRRAEELDFPDLKETIPIFFFGRDDIKLIREVEKRIREITPVYQIAILRKKEVRNARMEELRNAFEFAKAKMRIGMKFSDVFQFSVRNEMNLEVHPDYDTYFILGDGFVENTKSILGFEVKKGNLILRGLKNEERIYVPELKAVVSKKIGESLEVKYLSEVSPREIDLKRMIETNKEFLKTLERISVKFIEKSSDGCVGVPFSGGKDSLASLILAKKALKDVKAIYIRTNYEMPYTEEYVEEICKKLNVELLVEDAFLDVSLFGIPTHENRWCTAKKLEALKRVVEEERIRTLIVGDRDGESRVRRMRGFVLQRVAKEIFPIKHWSGAMVQLYDLMNGFELHPLYYEGFYRLGCTICPSLSPWERALLDVHKVQEEIN